MTLSMTSENAANPPQPMIAAWGPCFACNAAPVMHPLATEFQTSCFPRYFSTKHSEPPKTPVMKAKLRHQYNDLSAVARNVVRNCSRNGACGTSFPLMICTGGVASDMAPKNIPINNPIIPPPKTPKIDFPLQELVTHVTSGGTLFCNVPNDAAAVDQGTA